MLSLVSVPVLAAEMRKGAGSHEHTRECYTWMEKCVHEHTPECYPQKEITGSAATSSDAVEATECCHVCSEESGCITKELNCQYDSESTPKTAKALRSEEHTSELQSPDHLVCRLLLEKKGERYRTY